MAVPAANYSKGSEFGALVTAAAVASRNARALVLQAFAALDVARDAGAITAFLAEAKLGCPSGETGIAEATKVYEELASLKSKVESLDANTYGAAVLQFCAKLGV